jgi:hypothetical protein
MEIKNLDHLHFIKKSVKEIFHKDTNFRIEDYFVCLYYPTIEIRNKEKSIYIDCNIKGVNLKSDKKSIIEFLENIQNFANQLLNHSLT